MSGENSQCHGDQHKMFLYETSKKRPLDVVDVIGGHGPWQFRQWIVFFAASLCNSMILFSSLFLPVQAVCSDGGNAAVLRSYNNHSFSTANETEVLLVISKHVENNGTENFKTCNSTSCDDGDSLKESGMDSSMHLHEDQCWKSSNEVFIKCIYVIACIISQLFVYFSTKRFSRRNVSLVSCLFLIIPSAAATVTDNAPFFIVMRFVISFAILNVYLISAFSLMEYVHKDYKILYFLTGHLGWGTAHLLLPAIAWLSESWMSFNLALTIVCIVLSLIVWWGPESPSSFSNQAEAARSKKVLKYAAFTNGYSTSDVDMLSHYNNLQQGKQNDMRTPISSKEKGLFVFYSLFLFIISFTTTFLYLGAKWHTGWLKVSSGRVSFSFLGTTEIAAAIIILFLSCFVCIKHLWSCVSILASVIVLVIYSLNKKGSSRSSAMLYTGTVFFSSAAWTLMLAKCFCHKITNKTTKLNLTLVGLAVFAGALTASASALQEPNKNLLLAWGIPNLIASVLISFIPDDFFGRIA